MNVRVWTSIIFVLIAMGVVISMSVAGLILVLAILSIPAYIANLFSHSLKMMMVISWLLSLIFMWAGFFIAYWCNISIGACIVVLLALGMFAAIITNKFMREEESQKIAKRAVKIALFCVFITLLLSLINIYILINQISATAAMSKEIKVLQEKIGIKREIP